MTTSLIGAKRWWCLSRETAYTCLVHTHWQSNQRHWRGKEGEKGREREGVGSERERERGREGERERDLASTQLKATSLHEFTHTWVHLYYSRPHQCRCVLHVHSVHVFWPQGKVLHAGSRWTVARGQGTIQKISKELLTGLTPQTCLYMCVS